MATAAPLSEHDGRIANDEDFVHVEAEALHARTVRNSKKIFNIK